MKKTNNKTAITEEEIYKQAMLEKAHDLFSWDDDFLEKLDENPYHNIWSFLEQELDKGLFDDLNDKYFDRYQYFPSDKIRNNSTVNVEYTTEHRIQLVSVAEIQKKNAEWLIPGYIPKATITVLASDGGVGKTSCACEIAAAVSSGRHSIFVPDEIKYNTDPDDPGTVIFLSGEDTFEHSLRDKLEKCGANLNNILTVSLDNEVFENVKFGSAEMESIVADYRPKLIIFDPLQSFLPDGMNICSRVDMRNALRYPVAYGSKYGTTTLVLCHTNKRQNASARDRISDSSDLWDISRSVLMTGTIKDSETRYLSHEKSNYGELQETILYGFNDGKIEVTGRNDKRDGFYQRLKASGYQTAAPAKGEAESFILDLLANGAAMETNVVDGKAKDYGISSAALRRAKSDLAKNHKIARFSRGVASGKKHYMQIIQ